MKTATVNQQDNTVTIDGETFKIGDRVTPELVLPDCMSGCAVQSDGAIENKNNQFKWNLTFQQGNVRETREQAERLSRYRALLQRYFLTVAHYNEQVGWSCDFDDENQAKHHLEWNHCKNKVYPYSCEYIQSKPCVGYYYQEDQHDNIHRHFTDAELKAVACGEDWA